MAERRPRRNRSPPPSWLRGWSTGTETMRFNDYPPFHPSSMKRYRPYEPIYETRDQARDYVDLDKPYKHKKPIRPIKPRVDPPTSSRIAYGPWRHASDNTDPGKTTHAVDTRALSDGCGHTSTKFSNKELVPPFSRTGGISQEEPVGLRLPFSKPPAQPTSGPPSSKDDDFSSNHEIDAEGEFSGVLSKSLEYKEKCRGRGLYCHWCDIGMSTIEKYQQHLLGARHMKMLRKKGLEDEIGTPSQARINTGLVGEDGLKIMLCIVCKEECLSNKLAPHVTQSKHMTAEDNWRKSNKRLPRFIDMFVEKGVVPVTPAAANKLYCSVCNITLSSFEELEIHNAGKKHCRMVTALTDNQDNSFNCKLCDIRCTSKVSYQNHLAGKKHAMMLADPEKHKPPSNEDHGTTSSTPATYSCDVCNIKCMSVEQLKDHFMQDEHFRRVSTGSRNGGDLDQGGWHNKPVSQYIPPASINIQPQQPIASSPGYGVSDYHTSTSVPGYGNDSYPSYSNTTDISSSYHYNPVSLSWQHYYR